VRAQDHGGHSHGDVDSRTHSTSTATTSSAESATTYQEVSTASGQAVSLRLRRVQSAEETRHPNNTGASQAGGSPPSRSGPFIFSFFFIYTFFGVMGGNDESVAVSG
jgi:ABC-type Na+ efflux pump permease subunit